MKQFWQMPNIISAAFALAMNFLVGRQLLDVRSIGRVSDRYTILLTLATYFFSIWPLIYLRLSDERPLATIAAFTTSAILLIAVAVHGYWNRRYDINHKCNLMRSGV